MGLAERKRQLVRDELAEAALRLVAAHGFECTTVEQIVAKAGVSRRTFFRYFQSKEDVLVQFLDDLGAEICADVKARPADEPAAVAVREGLIGFAKYHQVEPEKALGLITVIFTTPALRARLMEKQDQWRSELTAVLAERTGAAPDDLRPALAAAVAFGALDVAMARWVEAKGALDPAELIKAALDLAGTPLR